MLSNNNWLANYNMAQQTESNQAKWESTFTETGISIVSAKTYVQISSREEIMRDNLHILDTSWNPTIYTKKSVTFLFLSLFICP